MERLLTLEDLEGMGEAGVEAHLMMVRRSDKAGPRTGGRPPRLDELKAADDQDLHSSGWSSRASKLPSGAQSDWTPCERVQLTDLSAEQREQLIAEAPRWVRRTDRELAQAIETAETAAERKQAGAEREKLHGFLLARSGPPGRVAATIENATAANRRELRRAEQDLEYCLKNTHELRFNGEPIHDAVNGLRRKIQRLRSELADEAA